MMSNAHSPPIEPPSTGDTACAAFECLQPYSEIQARSPAAVNKPSQTQSHLYFAVICRTDTELAGNANRRPSATVTLLAGGQGERIGFSLPGRDFRHGRVV
jgi:hypothetical protein